MDPRDLRDHKEAPKYLRVNPDFKPLKKGKLPKPLHRMGGGRVESTGLIDVSASHVMAFLARNGDVLTDRAFYAYLFVRLADDSLSTLFEFHWHPSHKGFHCKTACRATTSYTDRLLVQAPELNMKTDFKLDPWSPSDRVKLINIVCRACGVNLDADPELHQDSLWK